MEFKLFDSELKVMDILWKEGDTSAKEIAEKLNEQVGWSKTTTYTVIKKCIDKGAVGRSEPGFICRARIYSAGILRTGFRNERRAEPRTDPRNRLGGRSSYLNGDNDRTAPTQPPGAFHGSAA